MKVFYCDHCVLPLPPEHRFPMRKYTLLRQRVMAANQGQFQLQVAVAARDEEILLAHEAAYLQRVVSGTLATRDRLVFEHCARRGMVVAVTMAGGYAERLEDVVDIHFQSVVQAAAYAAAYS
jgi:acetoin utilization deacetylase AcuC-like enzyme